MRTPTRLTLAGAALTTVALAGAAVLPALADDRDASTAEEPAEAVPDRTQRIERSELHREDHQAAFAAALAEELDIDVERVAAALETVRAEHHDQVRGSDATHPGRGDGQGPRGGHRLWHDGGSDDDSDR
jgi:hypothetical protein